MPTTYTLYSKHTETYTHATITPLLFLVLLLSFSKNAQEMHKRGFWESLLQLNMSHLLSGIQLSNEFNRCLLETILTLEHTNQKHFLVLHSPLEKVVKNIDDCSATQSMKELTL